MASNGKQTMSAVLFIIVVCNVGWINGDNLHSVVNAGVPQQFSHVDKLPVPVYTPKSENVSQKLDTDDAYESLRAYATAPMEPFIRRRLFNTSVALTVPLFSFTLPNRGAEGSTIDLANQAIFGLFSLITVVLIFTVPILFTGIRPPGTKLTGRSNDNHHNILSHLMSSNKAFNLMGADFTNQIGIEPQTCLKKTICEAHRYPKRYGIIAVPFRIFFPPPSSTSAEARASQYQMAAKYGRYSKDECGKSYNCFFDVLDLTNYVIDWWNYSSNPDYVAE